MIDDAEVPTPRPGEPEAEVQHDDHGQRRDIQQDQTVGDDLNEGISQEDLKKAIPDAVAANKNVEKWSYEFVQNWRTYFRERFQPEHAGVINAIHSIEAYDEYVGNKKNELLRKKTLSEEKLKTLDEKGQRDFYKELSSEIERDVVLTISELFVMVDEAKPDEPFEEIIQADFMKSIRTNYDTILARLNKLRNEISVRGHSNTLPENLNEIKFYKKYSELEVSETVISPENGEPRTVYSQRPIPTARIKEASPEDFIRYVYSQTNHYMNLRKYLHNVSVIFRQGKGQHGFWDQVANYAKQMTTTDIDNIPLLPDANLFMMAHSLYIKHLTAEYAKHSWIHQPGMFSEEYFDVHTEIEARVLEDLKKLNPEITRKDGWRLARAMRMGIGIARGITLSEVEIAASADPVIKYKRDEKGHKKDVTYESFYISDSSALTAFRPTYNAERFMPPDMLRGPIFYSPVSGFKKDKFWNHNELWEKMRQYEDSYVEGRGKLNLGEDELLLIDAMNNFGKVGAIEYRSGWRLPRGYEAWLTKDASGKIDYLKSWQQLENIGFIVLRNFATIEIKEDKGFLKGKIDVEGEKRAFFNYLNKEYINFDPISGGVLKDLDTEISDIKKNNKNITDEDLTKLLLDKALYGVIRRRVPTMFIRLDRNRMAKDGIGAYERIKIDLSKNDPSWSAEKLDIALRNLSDVEAKLRSVVSKKMNDHLENHEKDLRDPTIKYTVNEAFIRESLAEIIGDTVSEQEKQRQIEDAVRLFKHIDENFLSPKNEFAKERINMLNKNKFNYTLCSEEFDSSFIAYRAAGDTVLYRSLNDTAQIEQDVAEQVQKHIDILKQVSIDPKRDMGPLIESLYKVRNKISVLHGDIEAFKRTSYLVGLTINYFRKDAVGKGILGLFNMGRKNSLAAEFAGTFRGVWEWNNSDIHNFILECERLRILPKDESELKIAPEIIPKSFLGFKYNSIKHKVDKGILTGKEARKLFGATYGDISMEMIFRYGPILLGILVYYLIKKAMEKEFTEKK